MAKTVPPLQILVVDDEPSVRSGVSRIVERMGFKAHPAVDGKQALDIMAEIPCEAVLLDIKMPGMSGLEVLQRIRESYPKTKVIMITGHPEIETAIECMKLGAMDYLVKPFRVDDLEALLLTGLKEEEAGRPEVPGLIGKSPAMQQVYKKIRRAAPSDSTILVQGESGTGKELVARAIHRLSARAEREFVPVDCSALVETLLESELFGHVRGSFTGACQTKHGLFELADQGTFFFDEISNLSLNIQAKLLRVIQEREFMKVGSQKRIKLDIRIIASSNRDLRDAVKEGTFREDLFYRLSVVPILLPPLRERSGDIPALVRHFIEKHGRKRKQTFTGVSKQAMDMLCAYPWPGNVRELEHTIERILILEDGDTMGPEHLPSSILRKQGGFDVCFEDMHPLEELEKRYIQFVLRRTGGRRQETARILGINRKTLTQKIRRHAIQDD
ncbi:MAG: sigma-54-dependent transcriptional regulator [Acidobacteriota bacterium]